VRSKADGMDSLI